MLSSPPHSAHWELDREAWLLALLSWTAYTALGLWVVSDYGAIGDAQARVANAYYVLFSRDPHLAAIGFVWTPLQSILALPLLTLKDLWPVMARPGAAANLITAGFGAIGVLTFSRIVRRLGLSSRLRRVIVLLFAINPGIVFYAINGMTDLILVVTLLAAVEGLWGYLEDGRLWGLLASSIWLAIGFLTRYEAAFWAAVVAIALVLSLARLSVPATSMRPHSSWIGGLVVLWLMPLVCACTIWLFLNWMIMGNPLFFATGPYSTVTQVGSDTNYASPQAFAARASLPATFGFVAQHALLFPPVVAGLLGLLAFGLSGRRMPHAAALVIVAAAIGVPLLQVLLVYRAASVGWARFFLSFIPFGFVSVVYATRLLAPRRAHALVWGTAVLALALGDLATYRAISPALPPDLRGMPALLHVEAIPGVAVAVRQSTGWLDSVVPAPSLYFEGFNGFDNGEAAIEYLDAHPDSKVLIDSQFGFPIIVGAHNPKQLIITSDRDFSELLTKPAGLVDALLVSRRADDAINLQYPGLRDRGEPWSQLVQEFPGSERWQLYAVAGSQQLNPLAQVSPAPAPTLVSDPSITVLPGPTGLPARSGPALSTSMATVTPAVTSTPAVSPAPEDLLPRQVVLDIDFRSATLAWPNAPAGVGWPSADGYHLAARQPTRFVAMGVPTVVLLRDAALSAMFHKTGGPPGGGYGLIVRDGGPGPRDGLNQGGRYYVLEVGDDGTIGVWRRETDHWVDLVPWTPAAAVHPGSAPNRLEVQASGTELTFVVNGIQVAHLADAVLPDGGGVGVFVGGDGNEVVVEHLRLETQPRGAPAPRP